MGECSIWPTWADLKSREKLLTPSRWMRLQWSLKEKYFFFVYFWWWRLTNNFIWDQESSKYKGPKNYLNTWATLLHVIAWDDKTSNQLASANHWVHVDLDQLFDAKDQIWSPCSYIFSCIQTHSYYVRKRWSVIVERQLN